MLHCKRRLMWNIFKNMTYKVVQLRVGEPEGGRRRDCRGRRRWRASWPARGGVVRLLLVAHRHGHNVHRPRSRRPLARRHLGRVPQACQSDVPRGVRFGAWERDQPVTTGLRAELLGMRGRGRTCPSMHTPCPYGFEGGACLCASAISPPLVTL